MTLPFTLREEKLLKLLQEKGYASIQELAGELSVSTMTVHRDLNRLAAAGRVAKTHGGASLVTHAGAVKDSCTVCAKPLSDRTLFLVNLPNGEKLRACCAHCGLMLHSQRGGVSMTADFLHNHMVSASQAVYLLQSELTVCCAPSVLTFGARMEAKKFQTGFGGQIAGMKEALQFLDAVSN